MAINSTILNSDVVNNEYQSDPGLLLSIENRVDAFSTSSGLMLSIENQVSNSLDSRVLLSIENRVINASATNTFYDRNGWEPFITLGAESIDADRITGEILVVKQENDNHLAKFSIILPPAIYNLYDYQGKAVTISINKNGVVRTIFTGIVDIPDVNVIEEKLTLNCIADRRKLLNANAGLEPYIGVFSPSVLGTNDDVYDRINARLSTVTAALDFDSYNNPTVTDWLPKASPDFSYGSSDVFRRDPQLQIESAGKIINQVNINFEYGYQRCHHRQLIYFWDHPYAPLDPQTGTGGICAFLEDRPSMPTKDLIRAAANGTGWPTTDFYFGKQFVSGSFNCSGAWVQWSTMETGYLNAPILNADGTAATDASGNPLSRSVQTVIEDNTDVFTMNAQWISSKRFNQNIKEQYSTVIKAPTSQTLYGVLDTTESFGITDVNSYQEWENYTSYQERPTGVTIHETSALSDSYYFDGDQGRNDFNLAYLCALYKAKSTILASHRDTTIRMQREITPEMELKHTVELTGKWIHGKGKVRRIEHHMSVSDSSSGTAGEAWTHIEMSQYRGVGTISETPIAVAASFSDSMTVVGGPAALETHLGEDPNGPNSVNWTGYVGNIAVRIPVASPGLGQVFDNTRTNYSEAFIVNTPAIEDEFRNDRILSKAVNYNINIPNDDTSYESYG